MSDRSECPRLLVLARSSGRREPGCGLSGVSGARSAVELAARTLRQLRRQRGPCGAVRSRSVKLERSARLALYVSRPPSVLLGITASHAATKGSRAPRLPSTYTEPLPMLARMPRRPKGDRPQEK